MTAAIQHMSINHRCAHILMPQQFLDRSNIITILKQMSGEAVPECMARHVLDKASLRYGLLYSLLDNGLVDMMTALFPCFAIPPAAFLRKDPLPAPICGRVGVFSVESIRHLDSAPAVGQVLFMDVLDSLKVFLECLLSDRGSMVTRSFAPLPSRTVISFRAKSTS